MKNTIHKFTVHCFKKMNPETPFLDERESAANPQRVTSQTRLE
jgi:hypothetical protein